MIFVFYFSVITIEPQSPSSSSPSEAGAVGGVAETPFFTSHRHPPPTPDSTAPLLRRSARNFRQIEESPFIPKRGGRKGKGKRGR